VVSTLDAPRQYDGVDAMLDAARDGLDRVTPADALEELVSGDAVLVDTRPAAQRAAQGEVAPWLNVVVVERNVLEWRFDPRSDARLPEAAYDARVLVLCQEGYSSSLAARALRQLGVRRATDVVGGFEAWRAGGHPVSGPSPV
jgi:rhodanese-related sulfurtransferase